MNFNIKPEVVVEKQFKISTVVNPGDLYWLEQNQAAGCFEEFNSCVPKEHQIENEQEQLLVLAIASGQGFSQLQLTELAKKAKSDGIFDQYKKLILKVRNAVKTDEQISTPIKYQYFDEFRFM